MKQYHKIQSLYLRDPAQKHKRFILGQFSVPEFAYLKDNIWDWTEKVDGTNIRVMWDGERVTLGGKSDNAQIPALLVTALQELFPVEKFKGLDPICLYGEGYGAKIQKGGGRYRADQSFVLFDTKCGDWWLRRSDVHSLAITLEIDEVPVVGRGTLAQAEKFAGGGFLSGWGSFTAEGIVLRPEVQLFDRKGHRIITKLKYRDFN